MTALDLQMARVSNQATARDDRFWAKVQKTPGCWLWTASKNRYGYGKFSAGTRGRWIGAHRYSYGLAYGAIPDGMHVLHKCDNPACVRPDHLFLGTQRENLVDMTEKGRRYIPFSEGERNGRAKLTAQQVVEIRHRIAGGERRSAMAKIYGVCLSSINNIVWGKTWRTDKGGWGNDKSTPVKVKHEA